MASFNSIEEVEQSTLTSTSNCVESIEEKYVIIRDITGGEHKINVIDENMTYIMLEEKVKKHLKLEHPKYYVIFLIKNNGNDIKIENKNDIIDNYYIILGDSYEDIKVISIIIDINKNIPNCLERDEMYNLEKIQSFSTSNTITTMSKRINLLGNRSFIYKNIYFNYDVSLNKWTSNELSKDVYHVYPNGLHLECREVCIGYSYLNTTIIPINDPSIITVSIEGKYVIKNINDEPGKIELEQDLIEEERTYKNRYIEQENEEISNVTKYDKYIAILINDINEKTYTKILIYDAETTSLIRELRFDKIVHCIFVDSEFIGIYEESSDHLLYMINIEETEFVYIKNNNKYIGSVHYSKKEQKYEYKSAFYIGNIDKYHILDKEYIVLFNNYTYEIDILRIKHD